MPYKDPKKRINYRKEYYSKNREKLLIQVAKRRKMNPDVIKLEQKKYYQKNKEYIGFRNKAYALKHREHLLKLARIRSARKVREIKIETINYYSGGSMECACCGEKEILFLSIDHINNDGAKERREIKGKSKGGVWFYISLKKRGFPIGYQVLCMNCNLGKHLNKGKCPHQIND